MKTHTEFAKKYNGDPVAVWVMILWSDETKIELFNQFSKRCLCRNLLLTPQKISKCGTKIRGKSNKPQTNKMCHKMWVNNN